MKTSQEGINFIKVFEGLHDGNLDVIGLQPKPCPAHKWTVGYGHAVYDKELQRQLSSDVPSDFARIPKELLNLTQQEAEDLLRKDLVTYENIVNHTLKVEVDQNQFDSLVSHTFNCGASETLYRLINTDANLEDIYQWWVSHYIRGGGVPLAGLKKRRKAEADNYFKV